MQANKILQSDLLDIIFEDRNKAYGAYELRKQYSKRIAKALLITALLFFVIILSSFISKKFDSNRAELVRGPKVELSKVKPPEEKLPPPPVIPPPPLEQQVKITAFIPPKAVEDELVVEPPPLNKELKDEIISDFEQKGIDPTTLGSPPADKIGLALEKKEEVDDDSIVMTVQEEATVDKRAWMKHLEKYLMPAVENAASQGLQPGQYTMQIRFLVEKDGSINDVKALSDPGYGLANEAIRILKNGPTWSPGVQNGRKVRSYHTQPITIIVPE